jgi:hypothetical protein
MKRATLLAAAIVCAAPATALASATLVIVNADAAGEGFNDPTPIAPVGGNTGTTVGQQRLNAFQFAADKWGAVLNSGPVIRINANFDPLTCTATSAVLGSAGATTVHSDFPGAVVPGTWYNGALANKLAGEDLDPATAEINARFNSSLNGDPACLGGGTWYYGFDHNEGVGQTDLLPVLMHEFGHGLGFQSFVARTGNVGSLFLGQSDHFTNFIFDNQANKLWTSMTTAERAVSIKNGRRVVHTGANVIADAAALLIPGTPVLRVNSPAAIAGTYQVGEASFGPRLAGTALDGTLLYAADSTAAFTGCNPYAAGTFTGRTALIDRGVCGFTVKVKNAQDAGATAVVIADNAAGSPPAGLGGADATITIPAVRITLADANAIKAQLAGGVATSLLLDLAIRAGADAAGRVMLNTPDPIVPGSSVSHWDPSTTPNTLMEPAINADLTTNVDLTASLFRDSGWFAEGELVTSDALTYTNVDVIGASWARMPGNATDWVGIAPAGSPATTVNTWVYTGGTISGTTGFDAANLTPGSYVVRAFVSDSYTILAESAPFAVVAATPGGITTDATTYAAGQAIVVTWSGLSTNPTNWIAYAPAGSPDTTVTRWTYTGGQAAGSFAFEGTLTAGTYVARSFANDTYNKTGESASFVVQ